MSPLPKKKPLTATQKNKQVRARAIVSAARKIFESEGYERTKIADIATTLGIVEGTIFHYFSSKKNLLVNVIEDFYQEITKDLNEGLEGLQGIRNQLYFIIHFHFKILKNYPSLCSVILLESRAINNPIKDDVRAFNREYTAPFRQILKQGVGTGLFRTDLSTKLVQSMIYGSIESIMWAVFNDGKQIDLSKAANELTEMLYHGIAIQTKNLAEGDVQSLIFKLNELLLNTR